MRPDSSPNAVVGRWRGAQFDYHAHRNGDLEHGHLHLFCAEPTAPMRWPTHRLEVLRSRRLDWATDRDAIEAAAARRRV